MKTALSSFVHFLFQVFIFPGMVLLVPAMFNEMWRLMISGQYSEKERGKIVLKLEPYVSPLSIGSWAIIAGMTIIKTM